MTASGLSRVRARGGGCGPGDSLEATECSPDDPATWTQPVIRLGMFTQPPFIEAANTPRLHAAFDQLAGKGRWRRPAAMGTFPVRFPSAADPGDAGTVYLCHPFLVHAAQPHRGVRPRFLAQPPLLPSIRTIGRTERRIP